MPFFIMTIARPSPRAEPIPQPRAEYQFGIQDESADSGAPTTIELISA